MVSKSRRKFIISAAAVGSAVYSGVVGIPLSKSISDLWREFYPEQYPGLDSGMTIDQYVQLRGNSINIRDNTKKLLTDNKGHIDNYAIQNNIPPNLLAAALANEDNRELDHRVRDFVWDRLKGYHGWVDARNKQSIWSKDPSEGVMQMKIRLASLYLRRVLHDKFKGSGYIEKKLGEKYRIDIPELQRLTEGFTKDSAYDDLWLSDKIKLTKSVMKLLSCAEMSIELAANHISDLRNIVEYHHNRKFKADNPVLLRVLAQGYLNGRNPIGLVEPIYEKRRINEHWIKSSNDKQRNIIADADKFVSLIKSGSYISESFSSQEDIIGQQQRVFNLPLYKEITGKICVGYMKFNNREPIGAYKLFRNASDKAAEWAKIAEQHVSKREIYKLALYTLAHANMVARDLSERGLSRYNKKVEECKNDFSQLYKEAYLRSGKLDNTIVRLPGCENIGLIADQKVPPHDEHMKKVEAWQAKYKKTTEIQTKK